MAGSPTLTNAAPGLASATQTETIRAAAATQIRVETLAIGTGAVTMSQNVPAGNSTNLFAIFRDPFGNFVTNDVATWALINAPGGVTNTDLVVASDAKSATFTGYLIGSAVVQAISPGMSNTVSGTLTVVAGFANKLAITTAPQILTAGINSAVITVQLQDGFGNPANTTSNRVITLTSSSLGAVFRNVANTATITTLTIPTGFNSTNYRVFSKASFLVLSSLEPITYQWSFHGQPIAGETHNSFTLPYVEPLDAGLYSVEARTECAVVTRNAELAVVSATGISPISYTNSQPIIIDESGAAIPGCTVITPECVPGRVRNLTVSIFGYSHEFPDDISVVLVGPDGHQVKLIGGAGGGYETPLALVNLTFSDATTNLPQYDQIFSGTYLPTDYRTNEFLPAPAGGPYTNRLAAFIGSDPNGSWKLCVFDSTSLDGGSISSWSLDLDWREPALYLQNPRVLPTGEFRAEVVGQTGLLTLIERSADLVTWRPVVTNVYRTNPGVFRDPAPLSPYRYYRAIQR